MPAIKPRPYRRASTGDAKLDGMLDEMSRAHIQMIEHVTGTVSCAQEMVTHGLGVRARCAWIGRHNGTDGFTMYADLEDETADTISCPVRFTETDITVWIVFVA